MVSLGRIELLINCSKGSCPKPLDDSDESGIARSNYGGIMAPTKGLEPSYG